MNVWVLVTIQLRRNRRKYPEIDGLREKREDKSTEPHSSRDVCFEFGFAAACSHKLALASVSRVLSLACRHRTHTGPSISGSDLGMQRAHLLLSAGEY